MHDRVHMTASLFSCSSISLPGRAGRVAALALTFLFASCTRAARDADHTPALVAVTGAFLADGSCQATVDGAALFAAIDRQHTTYDAGAVADVAPAGYAMHQLACAPADAEPGAPDSGGERLVLITLYTREGSSLRAGRYTVRAGLATADDTAGAATRAAVAVFGVAIESGAPGGGSRDGVRYLEGREGELTITSADSARVVATFSVRAGAAWSM